MRLATISSSLHKSSLGSVHHLVFKITGLFLITALAVMIYLLFRSTKWLNAIFPDTTIHQIVYHLRMPMDGAGIEVRSDFFAYVLHGAIPFLTTVSALFLFVAIMPLTVCVRVAYRDRLIADWSLRSRSSFLIIMSALVGILLLQSMNQLNAGNRLIAYLKSVNSSSLFIEDHYVHPESNTIRLPTQRNLILIYAESLENSFFHERNGGVLHDEVLPNLTQLIHEGVHFSHTDQIGGALQVEGTGWTVAGLVAVQFGLPLKLPVHGNNHHGRSVFLPNATGITDVLSEEGYNQVFLMGSDKAFAGRDTLLETHGNVLVKDLHYYRNVGRLPSDYKVWWGFEDRKLFAFAREELELLSQENAPFNLMMLTADTHHVDGYLDPECDAEFDHPYKNVLRCSDRQLGEFLEWLRQQPYYQNTTVVILGDHLFMNPDFFGAVGVQAGERRIFNLFLNAVIEPRRSIGRQFSLMDMFPTILAAMGATMSNDRLGLGTSLFSNTPTLIEEYSLPVVNRELAAYSRFYDMLFYP